MPTHSSSPTEAVRRVTAFLTRLFPAPRAFEIRLWDGTIIPGTGADDLTVTPATGTARASGTGNDFFQLFLDSRMVCSCAYFPTGAEDLDGAQEKKLDHVCRKRRLQQGDRMLDIGCGWGALVMHAAERYGVRALGVTLSEQQHALAQRRIAEAGLEDRAEVRLADYRDVRVEPSEVGCRYSGHDLQPRGSASRLGADRGRGHRNLERHGAFTARGIPRCSASGPASLGRMCSAYRPGPAASSWRVRISTNIWRSMGFPTC